MLEISTMKHVILSALLLVAAAFSAQAQNPLDVSLHLNAAEAGPEGIPVTFAIQAGGAVLTETAFTDADGLGSTTFDVPPGTMQGLVFATYFDCDSVEAIVTGTFYVNALGGLAPVEMTGDWCGGGSTGGGCNPLLAGEATLAGAWAFMVLDAPEDGTYEWSVDGITVSDNYTSEFIWPFEAGGVYSVCVTMNSATCGTWTDCYTVDTTGGNTFECAISFIATQTFDADSNFVANSVDVWVPQFDANAQYFWDFGDEGSSTEALPTHVYAGNGPYVLCVTATWDSPAMGLCTATYCDTLELDADGILQFVEGFTINVYPGSPAVNAVAELASAVSAVYPNPVAAGTPVAWTVSAGQTLDRVELIDALGRPVRALRGGASLPTEGLAPGTYLLRFTSLNGQARTQRLIIQ